METVWVICPVCKRKTHTKLRQDTTLTNFPLFCPKCKQETLVDVRQFNIKVIERASRIDAEPMISG